mmetsp:Transcript_21419/g.52714  ORF Transcript_21419/g.52714 Transcript_21419/m.52714 type:complete len:208 (-) Transcript_21419:250-873(-)
MGVSECTTPTPRIEEDVTEDGVVAGVCLALSPFLRRGVTSSEKAAKVSASILGFSGFLDTSSASACSSASFKPSVSTVRWLSPPLRRISGATKRCFFPSFFSKSGATKSFLLPSFFSKSGATKISFLASVFFNRGLADEAAGACGCDDDEALLSLPPSIPKSLSVAGDCCNGTPASELCGDTGTAGGASSPSSNDTIDLDVALGVES